jgi:hypothetical protein
MPVSRPLAFACFALALAGQASHAQAPQAGKAKAHAAAPAGENPFMHVDDWFSYGRTEADVEKAAPGVRIKARDPHEDDIIVYGQRQKRDFEGASRDANLTSPQGLDAAQPVVPGIGDSCSYKGGCYDMGQTPLRSVASSLIGGD